MRTPVALGAALVLAACSGGAATRLSPPVAQTAHTATASSAPIRHIVIVVQENRSFDNLFAGYPGADAPMQGKASDGSTVPLHSDGMVTIDICHGWNTSFIDYDGGKMDGFDKNCTGFGHNKTFAYAYVRRQLVEPYWSMARQYTLADRMFPTIAGPSWTAHLALIAGTASLNPTTTLINIPSDHPWGCDAPAGTTSVTMSSSLQPGAGPFPCLMQFRTLADTLDAGSISWRYYAPPIDKGGIWTAFDAIRHVRYGSDWNRMISPSPRFLTDVKHGKLANVTWVVPDWKYSDHAPGGNLGPSWVSAVVNAVGESSFWKSTAIVVLWDDWGGWYDDAPPPQLDYRGLGLRVPCIVISPYARRGYVTHTQYEFGSILKFVEETFGLPPLGSTAEGYTDERATSISNAFDFTQSPRGFTAIAAPYPPSTFLRMPPSLREPDDE